MANVTTITGKAVLITGLDENWDFRTEIPASMRRHRIHSVQFNPSAVNDVCKIRNLAATGTIFECKCSGDTDQRVKYFEHDSDIAPFLVISECTLSNAALASIILILY